MTKLIDYRAPDRRSLVTYRLAPDERGPSDADPTVSASRPDRAAILL
jgi:hypothetical protein